MTLPGPPGKGQAEHTSDSEAVALFAARATAAGGFELTDANAGAVIDICRRLDGIPLAIKLAGARCSSLTPEQLAGRLDDRFRLLTGGSRSVPRQRTLEAAIDWSHQLLSRREQVLFRRLACFSGTFTLEAAEAVAQSAPLARPDVAELVDGLVSRSLLLFVPSPTALSAARDDPPLNEAMPSVTAPRRRPGCATWPDPSPLSWVAMIWVLFQVPCPTPDGQTAEDPYQKRVDRITPEMQASSRKHGCHFHRAWYAADGSAFYALALWESREAANAFFEEWDIADEPGEVAIRLEGDVGLVPIV